MLCVLIPFAVAEQFFKSTTSSIFVRKSHFIQNVKKNPKNYFFLGDFESKQVVKMQTSCPKQFICVKQTPGEPPEPCYVLGACLHGITGAI